MEKDSLINIISAILMAVFIGLTIGVGVTVIEVIYKTFGGSVLLSFDTLLHRIKCLAACALLSLIFAMLFQYGDYRKFREQEFSKSRLGKK